MKSLYLQFKIVVSIGSNRLICIPNVIPCEVIQVMGCCRCNATKRSSPRDKGYYHRPCCGQRMRIESNTRCNVTQRPMWHCLHYVLPTIIEVETIGPESTRTFPNKCFTIPGRTTRVVPLVMNQVSIIVIEAIAEDDRHNYGFSWKLCTSATILNLSQGKK